MRARRGFLIFGGLICGAAVAACLSSASLRAEGYKALCLAGSDGLRRWSLRRLEGLGPAGWPAMIAVLEDLEHQQGRARLGEAEFGLEDEEFRFELMDALNRSALPGAELMPLFHHKTSYPVIDLILTKLTAQDYADPEVEAGLIAALEHPSEPVAASVYRHIRRHSKGLRAPSVERLIALLSSENATARSCAARLIAREGASASRASSALQALLLSEDKGDRKRAVAALSAIGYRNEADFLARTHDASSEVRAAAAKALGALQPPSAEALARLRTLAAGRKRSRVTRAARRALEALGDPRPEAALSPR